MSTLADRDDGNTVERIQRIQVLADTQRPAAVLQVARKRLRDRALGERFLEYLAHHQAHLLELAIGSCGVGHPASFTVRHGNWQVESKTELAAVVVLEL